MDLDHIKRIIQDFFQENTVTIVGSGLSAAEGIPGMSALGIELNKSVPLMLHNADDIALWSKISDSLSSNIGLEQALHITAPSQNIEEAIRKVTAKFIGNAEMGVLYKVLASKKTLRFSEYIDHFNIRNNGLVVITTNYDRLVEYACEARGIRIDNLFVGRYIAQYEPEHSKYMFCRNLRSKKHPTVEFSPRVTVLKPHGCLSWHMVDGTPFCIPQAPVDDSLIITPGINKYKEGYNIPFDGHRTKANNAIDGAQRYIIIGYGFNDDHLETHLVPQLKSGKTALILTHSLSDKAIALVKECKNITAICSNGEHDSIVITQDGEYLFPGTKLWDLHDMLKEVF